jgi:hypothetical protein
MGGGGIICWDHRYYIYGQMTSYSAPVPKNAGKEMEWTNYGGTTALPKKESAWALLFENFYSTINQSARD